MDAFPIEMLRSERHADGFTHAIYPTALLSLCGRGHEPQGVGRPGQPTCMRCLAAALRFRRIDASVPAGWRYAT